MGKQETGRTMRVGTLERGRVARNLSREFVAASRELREALALGRPPSGSSSFSVSTYGNSGWRNVLRTPSGDETRETARSLRILGARVMIILHSDALKNGYVVTELDS